MAALNERPRIELVLFFSCFFAAAFACQCFFYAFFLAGLQVKRVSFYFLDNILGLYLSFEATQRIFEGFSLLNSNFRQRTTPPCSSLWTRKVIASLALFRQVECMRLRRFHSKFNRMAIAAAATQMRSTAS
jgi:hypothetical protein